MMNESDILGISVIACWKLAKITVFSTQAVIYNKSRIGRQKKSTSIHDLQKCFAN